MAMWAARPEGDGRQPDMGGFRPQGAKPCLGIVDAEDSSEGFAAAVVAGVSVVRGREASEQDRQAVRRRCKIMETDLARQIMRRELLCASGSLGHRSGFFMGWAHGEPGHLGRESFAKPRPWLSGRC